MGTGRRMRRVSLVARVAASAATARGEGRPAGADLAAAELWRRGHCILSSVVVPAQRTAKAPRDLRGARPVEGRTYSAKVKVAAWARDERFLWAATDAELHQVDLAEGRLVRSYAKADGLPDWPVDALLSDGRTLWIVHRRGLATLGIGRDKVEDRADVRFRFARLLRDEGGVWAIADNATWRFAGDGPPKRLPALPTGSRITATVKAGLWLARRGQQTAYFVADALSLGGRLYAASFGAVYELADGRWSRVAAEGWTPRAGHGCLWLLSTKGLVRYEPATRQSTLHGAPKPLPSGRPTHLAVTEGAVWVAVEPREEPRGRGFAGGGIARLDVRAGRWQTWQSINGQRANRATALETRDGAVWATAIGYETYKTLSAHPGMMHCKRTVPVPTGLCLHRFDVAKGTWQTLHLASPAGERRRVLGQKGKQHDAVMIPRIVEATAASASRLFAVVRMFPTDFYSGYYTCIDQLAARPGAKAAWTASYAHAPEPLGLQGEQPSVLLISESHGKRVVYGVGHDHVLGLFAHAGRAWAVTEGGVGCFDEGKGRWQRVLETGFRFYWKATAARDDGERLWIGSDRGIVARLDLATNRCQVLTVLAERQIVAISAAEGRTAVLGKRAERGCLPVQLEGKLEALDCDGAVFDGKPWKPADVTVAAPPGVPWRVEGKANFLSRIDPRTRKPVAAYYLTGVFQPRVLCASPDGRRVWLSTYSGLVRIDRQR